MILLAKKGPMSQIWKDEKVIPVTMLIAEPNTVALVRTKEKDGYEGTQIRVKKGKKTVGREFRVVGFEKGSSIDVSAFKEGDKVRVSGYSKGRGFQGVVKRHGFHGGPKTHGQKNRHRAPGSLGSTAPQRVVPGRKMAGRMGQDRVTVKSMKVVGISLETNTLMVKGPVPGSRGGIIEIQKIS
jgi:large subunit ribosomal protein L3